MICHGSLTERTAVPGIWRLAAFLEGPRSGTEVWCRFGLQSPCEDAVFPPRWKNASIFYLGEGKSSVVWRTNVRSQGTEKEEEVGVVSF